MTKHGGRQGAQGPDRLNPGAVLGNMVMVRVDRPMGSAHPEYPGMVYPVNYGYIPGMYAPDGEEQDAYVLGADGPVDSFTGRVVAIIRREDDVEDKLVVAPPGKRYHQGQVMEAVFFCEQYFRTKVICLFEKSCGVVVCRRTGGRTEFLLLFQLGSRTWSFPKGHAEAFESERQTAARELREETGIVAPLTEGFRASLSYRISPIRTKQVVLFLAETSGEAALKQDEIAVCTWADQKTAAALLGYRQYEKILERARRALEK